MNIFDRLGVLDWIAIAFYFTVVVAIGFAVRRRGEGERGFVQGNRTIPFWAVGLSMVATAVAADDFVGNPQFSLKKDLALLGAFAVGYIGVITVAVFFLPKYYQSNALTIYGYLGQRFGRGPQIASSIMSCLGNVFSAGVGLFIASFAITPLMSDGSLEYDQLRPWVTLIIISIGCIGTLYTTIGGIRSVIWTDVFQMVVIFAGGSYAIWYLASEIPLGAFEMVDRWNEAAYEVEKTQHHGKLTMFRNFGGVSNAYSPWSLPLWIVFFIGIFGTNHSYTQRLLACRSAARAGIGMVFGYTAGMLSAVMFFLIGLLLFLYNDPKVMGTQAASAGAFANSEEAFARLVVDYFPAGLLGLSLAMMVAAVMSSFDSATAAIASSFMADVVRPIGQRFFGVQKDTASKKDDSTDRKSPWMATALAGLLLTGSGAFAAMNYDPESKLLVDFALGFASFPIGGMLGVFCTALFTRRGNARSVVAALIAGPLVWTFVQPGLLDKITEPLFGVSITLDSMLKYFGFEPLKLAYPWWFSIAAVVSFFICWSGKPIEQTTKFAIKKKDSQG